MSRKLIAKIYLDEDKVELPDYEWTLGSLIEETGCSVEEACNQMNERFNMHLDHEQVQEGDMDEIEFSEKVKQEDREKFCAKLLDIIKSHIPELINIYNSGDLENIGINVAVSEAGEELYTENPDDLGWEFQSDLIEVEIDGEKQEIKG